MALKRAVWYSEVVWGVLRYSVLHHEAVVVEDSLDPPRHGGGEHVKILGRHLSNPDRFDLVDRVQVRGVARPDDRLDGVVPKPVPEWNLSLKNPLCKISGFFYSARFGRKFIKPVPVVQFSIFQRILGGNYIHYGRKFQPGLNTRTLGAPEALGCVMILYATTVGLTGLSEVRLGMWTCCSNSYNISTVCKHLYPFNPHASVHCFFSIRYNNVKNMFSWNIVMCVVNPVDLSG